jgi:hypothetical protein
MDRSSEIDRLIDKSHMWSTRKVIEYVQGQIKKKGLAPVSAEFIKSRNATRLKHFGRKVKNYAAPHYEHPIYSNHWYGYQMDLLEQSKDKKKDADPKYKFPPFFFILINTNTRFCYAYAMKGKSQEEIERCLDKAWTDTGGKIKSIVCDDEAGFSASNVEKWYKDHKVSCKVIADSNHTALGVVDRMIKTLRDMNTPTMKGKKTSEHPKYRDFTQKRMDKLLEIYNSTSHKRTGHKPKEMHENRDEETKYIIKKLYAQERRRKIKDYELENGCYVRYILPRDPLKKNRYKVSPEAYQIKARDGNSYVLMAKDGATQSMSRWRLIPIGNKLPKGMKLGATLNDAKRGRPLKIKGHAHNKYLIRWETPDGVEVADTWNSASTVKGMRTHPDTLHPVEKKFWDKRKAKGETIPKWVFRN